MNSRKCFIMGLPSAGKTTFLAAFWYSVQEKDKTLLTLKELKSDQSYLADLSNTWVGFEKVSRTSIDNEQNELFVMLTNREGDLFEVSFPDLSGESFQKQYVHREIKKGIVNDILTANAFLFFINPLETVLPCLISNIKQEIRQNETGSILTRSPLRDDPTAVQIVELLQFIREIKVDEMCKIGIVVSAWDLEEANKHQIPEEYVKNQLPFLWQYLFSNKSAWETSYYGVSAQGGSIESLDEIIRLSENSTEPIERIMIVNNHGEIYNDLTMLISHLLIGEEGV